MSMAKRIVLTEDPPLKTCVGCRTCELACSFFHEKKFNPQKSRIRIVQEGPAINRPVVCMQCPNAPCMKVCPEEGAMWRDSKGVVRVDDGKCTGCGECVEACPFGAIWLHPDTNKAINCDLCGGDPQCVRFCPQGVLSLR
ncbi:MAG: 4Fe-4S dicluster domain-containing protein [Candidatus Hadarchaeota archaeon]|nr:4Fe-4S dicluster domain-containing protein [Candidatus Hadarchaeota archaeon]